MRCRTAQRSLIASGILLILGGGSCAIVTDTIPIGMFQGQRGMGNAIVLGFSGIGMLGIAVILGFIGLIGFINSKQDG
jgi:hypothetical protein